VDGQGISWRVEGAVGWIGLDRPARRNALRTADWQALGERCAEAVAIGLRALVLHGSGGAFCAGADIDELAAQLGSGAGFEESNRIVQATQLALERLPLPTLAMIDGACVGGGLGLALACDFRIASPRTRFALTPARLGLAYSPDDTARLVRTLGAARAKQLLMLGVAVDAEHARSWGLVDQVVDVDELEATATGLAQRLAEGPPAALAAIKRVIAHAAGDPGIDRAEAERLFAQAFGSAEFAEGAAAFLERREPRFG
jgi:enoyl-CoA hydratase/carnithine racemase